MNKRENFLAMIKKQPYKEVPVDFALCPALIEQFRKKTGSELDHREYYGFPWREVPVPKPVNRGQDFKKYYPQGLKEGTYIDDWGVAHEPGSAAAFHMTQMRHPLSGDIHEDDVLVYPFPVYDAGDFSKQQKKAAELRKDGLVSMGFMQMTIWETAWGIRSMEDLMADMMGEEPIAEILLSKIEETAIARAEIFARAGVDILYIGDDIGMQHSAMMSNELYKTWLWPLHKSVIDAARRWKPDILVFYHSCGKIDSFIPGLIEAGVDVLNPIQPECMDFQEIYEKYHDKLSFCGTIGTQSTMPYGTEDDVRRAVFKNLDISDGGKGLFVTPTHVLEPDVPWENIEAYVKACKEYKG